MVWVLITVVFVVLRVLPGDPILSELGPKATAEQVERIRIRMGLNKPLIVQYGEFLWDVVTLDFGNALTQGERPIRDELGEKLPATIELTVPAIIFTAVFGILSGSYAAKNRKKFPDYALRLFSIVIYSIPIFFLGLVFQIIFSVRLGILPLYGRLDPIVQVNFVSPTNFYVLDALITQDWVALKSAVLHLVMPALTLGLALTGVFIRLTRVNMIEILQNDFIIAGRARGISERVLTYKHALRNTFIPILTLIGLQFAILMAGAVLTETTFS
jgi:peptide/nickel transport system permease protein